MDVDPTTCKIQLADIWDPSHCKALNVYRNVYFCVYLVCLGQKKLRRNNGSRHKSYKGQKFMSIIDSTCPL